MQYVDSWKYQLVKSLLGLFCGYYSWNVMALVKSSLGNPKQTLKCTQIWQDSYLLIFHEYCHDVECRKKVPGAEKILNFSFAYVCILLVQCTHCSFSTCGWIVPLLANLALNLPHKVTVKLSKNTFGILYFPLLNSKKQEDQNSNIRWSLTCCWIVF